MVWGGGFLSGVEGGLADLIFPGDGGAEVAPIDYAGGTVVHINAGVAGLVLALLIGKRLGFGKDPMRPHNLTLTMIGAGLLWFGWYGFNVGSIVFAEHRRGRHARRSSPSETGLVWLNTTLATCAAMLGWLIIERIRTARPPRSVPRPASSPVWSRSRRPVARSTPLGAIALGVVAGGALRPGGRPEVPASGTTTRSTSSASTWSAASSAPSASASSPPAASTACSTASGVKQLVVQTLGRRCFAIALVRLVATLIVGLAIKYTIGWRIAEEDEVEGIDFTEHGESAYDLGAPGGGRLSTPSSTATTPAAPVSEGANA